MLAYLFMIKPVELFFQRADLWVWVLMPPILLLCGFGFWKEIEKTIIEASCLRSCLVLMLLGSLVLAIGALMVPNVLRIGSCLFWLAVYGYVFFRGLLPRATQVNTAYAKAKAAARAKKGEVYSAEMGWVSAVSAGTSDNETEERRTEPTPRSGSGCGA